jgi:lysophospholipase L1-like esterase
MGQKSSDSASTSSRGRMFRPSTSRMDCGPRVASLSGLIALVMIYYLLQNPKPFSTGSVLLKFFDNSTISSAEQRLTACDAYELHGSENNLEELMMTTRNWPRNQDFNIPSHCIYEHEDDADMKQCQCRNPTIPVPRTAEFWQTAFHRNQAFVKKASQQSLDVVLLGDSITEHWIGEAGGRPNDAYAEHLKVFQKILTRKGGGSVEAAALGIAADRIPNLLFRIQAGQYGQLLKPRVWWILIGSNDMAMGWCNEDAVLAGNIAVVEEIRATQPNAIVVINSILPRLGPNIQLQKHIDGLNTRLRDYACETKDVYFFNATSIFRDEDGNVHHLPDGVHPDGPSSWIWAREIAEAVMELSAMR